MTASTIPTATLSDYDRGTIVAHVVASGLSGVTALRLASRLTQAILEGGYIINGEVRCDCDECDGRAKTCGSFGGGA